MGEEFSGRRAKHFRTPPSEIGNEQGGVGGFESNAADGRAVEPEPVATIGRVASPKGEVAAGRADKTEEEVAGGYAAIHASADRLTAAAKLKTDAPVAAHTADAPVAARTADAPAATRTADAPEPSTPQCGAGPDAPADSDEFVVTGLPEPVPAAPGDELTLGAAHRYSEHAKSTSHRHHHHRRHRRGRSVLIALLVMVVLVLAGAGGAYAWWRNSVEQGRRAMTEQIIQRAQDHAGTIEYDGKRWRLNEDIVTVCFIGYDNTAEGQYKGGQSDTILVIALNTATGAAKAINIPRDSMVTVDAYIGDSYAGQTVEQICLQYSYGDGAHRSSELTTSTVSRLLYNVPINYYFTLNITGVATLNDAVGGVTLTALQDIPTAGIIEGEEVTLYGKDAQSYVQYRVSDETGSLGRQERQIQYVRAYISKVIELAQSDPGKLLDLYDVAQSFTYTNLGVDEFAFLADVMISHGVTGLDVAQLEGEMTRGTTYAEYNLDKDFLRQQVIETFYEVVE